MATPMKSWIIPSAVIILCLILFNRLIVMPSSDDVWRAKVLKFQFSCVIMTFSVMMNWFVWWNLSTLFDRRDLKLNDNDHTEKVLSQFDRCKTYTVKEALWRILMIFIQVSSVMSYTSFAFLINTDPYAVSIWFFLCLTFIIQVFICLVCVKVVSFIWLKITKRYTLINKKHSKFVSILILLYAFCAVTLGFYNASLPPEIKHVTVPLKDMPAEMSGLTITLVSDIHLGPTVGRKRMEQIVNMINYLQSDIVVIAGDLVDGRVDQLKTAVESLEWIKSEYGTYFVTGNHEYYTTDVHQWFSKLEQLGVKILHNANVKLPATGSNSICLAGVDDPTADLYRFMDHTMDLDKTLKSCDKSKPVILVAHQPKTAKIALESEYRVDLVLSGHTHGGQMFPVTIGAYLFNPFYAGLYRYGDHSHVYVTMGTMYWGFPVRFGTRAEITKIILVSA